MAELDLELEKTYLVQKTHCTEDAAWNFIIAEEEFFEEKESAGVSPADIDDEELFAYISERSGVEISLVKKLSEYELQFFQENDIG